MTTYHKNKNSYFTAILREGGHTINDMTGRWKDISSEKIIESRTLHVSEKVKELTVNYGGLSKTIEIPEGCGVFQAIRSAVTFLQDGTKDTKVKGRLMGIVKDDKIIEEYFIGNDITGYKYD